MWKDVNDTLADSYCEGIGPKTDLMKSATFIDSYWDLLNETVHGSFCDFSVHGLKLIYLNYPEAAQKFTDGIQELMAHASDLWNAYPDVFFPLTITWIALGGFIQFIIVLRFLLTNFTTAEDRTPVPVAVILLVLSVAAMAPVVATVFAAYLSVCNCDSKEIVRLDISTNVLHEPL